MDTTDPTSEDTLLIGLAATVGGAMVAMVSVAVFLLRRRCLRNTGQEMNHSKLI